MKDQHKLIKGYRDLTQEEIALMNRIKSLGDELGSLIWDLREENNHLEIDGRWLSIAETHLQQGIMAAVRSVAKPESF